MFDIRLVRRAKTATTVEPNGSTRTHAEMRPITRHPRMMHAWLAGVELRHAPMMQHGHRIPLGPFDLKIGWGRVPPEQDPFYHLRHAPRPKRWWW
jgi:hypothetical protein